MSKKSDHVEDLNDPQYDPPALDLSDTPEEPAAAEEAKEVSPPPPKPGDVDYDWAPHYPLGKELFRYSFINGQVIEIRKFGDIYSKLWLYSINDAKTESDVQFAAFDRAACDAAKSIVAQLDSPIDGPDQFEDFWQAWSKAGTAHADGAEGLSTGESRG